MTIQQLAIQGHVEIWKVWDTHKELHSSKKNMIVSTGLETLSRLIAQISSDDPVDSGVHSMWLEASTATLPSAAESDTGPQGTVVKYYTFDKAADVTPNAGAVAGLTEFRSRLAKGEANGQLVRAAGLYTRDDNDDPTLASSPQLVARQVFGSIEKTVDFAVEFVWKVQFSIVS